MQTPFPDTEAELTKALWVCRCGKQQRWNLSAGSHQHPLGARRCHPQKVSWFYKWSHLE